MAPYAREVQPSVATDGVYVFVSSAHGKALQKVGAGEAAVVGHVYASTTGVLVQTCR